MILADLHVHSNYSYDAFQTPRTVLETAESRGLDAVAITDHDSFGGSAAGLEIADDFDVLFVPGTEIRTDEYDDLVGLFLNEPVEERAFESAVDAIHDQNGLAVLPHPYRKFEAVPEWVLERVDAVEAFSARSKRESNTRAEELVADRDLPVLGVSDAHTSWEIGRGLTRVPLEPGELTLDRLKSALQAGGVIPEGDESPYLPTHGASVAMELVKKTTGIRSTEYQADERE